MRRINKALRPRAHTYIRNSLQCLTQKKTTIHPKPNPNEFKMKRYCHGHCKVGFYGKKTKYEYSYDYNTQ